MLLLLVYLRGKHSPTSHYEVIASNIVLGTIFTPLKKHKVNEPFLTTTGLQWRR